MTDWTVIQGDCRSVLATLPEKSVQCCATSPPYHGLRQYEGVEPSVWGKSPDEWCSPEYDPEPRREHEWGTDTTVTMGGGVGKESATGGRRWEASQGAFCQRCSAWRGLLGLEPTIEMYVEHIVECFRAVKRVLRDDGTLWLNVGDAYAKSQSTTGGYSAKSTLAGFTSPNTKGRQMNRAESSQQVDCGLPPKNLIGQPWLIAFALQADGWVLRSALPWLKRSAMPESATDRPTSALEYVFMLTKSPKYYFDMEAVRMKAAPATYQRDGYSRILKDDGPQSVRHDHETKVNAGGRSFRNTDLFFESLKPPFGLIALDGEPVALDVTPEGLKEKHFASFPRKLIRPLILASTSSKGCCPECSAPWRRVVEKSVSFESGSGKAGNAPKGKHEGTEQATSGSYDIRMGPVTNSKTLGWEPGCTCCRKCGIVGSLTKGDTYAAQRQDEGKGMATGMGPQTLGHQCRVPNKIGCTETEVPREMQAVQHRVHGAQGSHVLHATVLNQVDVGTREGESVYGRCNREVPLCNGSGETNASTPGGNAETSGEATASNRVHPSQKRGQGRQSRRQPCSPHEAGTRETAHKQAFGHTIEPYEPVACVVCDPYLGSGTTLIVANQLGRTGIGIEASPEYVKMARRRIANPEPEPEIPDVEGQLKMFDGAPA